MKKIYKLLGFVAILATFAPAMSSCANSENDSSNRFSKVTVKYQNGDSTDSVTITAFSPNPKQYVHEYVDLGLSVKWATCNVGATKPEEYGGYYQWAGTKDVSDKSIYLDESNCPYHTDSSHLSGWTKYIPSGKLSFWSGSGSPDNMTVLNPEDDVAHVKLGDKWRVPTFEEWDELETNCTWIWTSQNGVEGYKVTSKKNGNSIFLPAAGCRYGDTVYDVGSGGSYWSSSLSTDDPYDAYYMFFYLGYEEMLYTDRYNGYSVRPISE